MYDAYAFFKLLECNGDEKKALEYKNAYIPEYVYKFYSFGDNEGLYKNKMDALKNKQIYFSAIKDFNDPFEFQSFYIEKELFKDKETGNYNKLARQAAELRSFINQSMTRVACFVEDIKDIPMWAYYADSFRGYCVKYKITNKNHFFRVQYIKDKIPTFYPNSLLTDNSEKNFLKNAQMISTKCDKWKHEKEIRLVTKINGTNMSLDEGMLLPCKNLGLEPKEIIVGCKCIDKNIEALKIVNEQGDLNLSLKKIKLRKSKFKFKVKDIKN